MVQYRQGYQHYRKYYRRLQFFYKKKPVRDVTFLVLSLLTTAFFTFFAIKPSVKTISELVKEVKDKRTASAKLEQKINALSLAQREYASIQSELPIIYAALPKESDFSKLAKQVEYLAGQNNVLLSNFRLQRINLFGQEEKELVPFEFSLNLTGEYASLKSFIDNLERLDRIVAIQALSFSKSKATKEESKTPLSLKIGAKGYYLP